MSDVLTPPTESFPKKFEHTPSPEEVNALNQSLRTLVAEQFAEGGEASYQKRYELSDGAYCTVSNRASVAGSLIEKDSAARFDVTWFGAPENSQHTGVPSRRELMWSIPKVASEPDDLQISDLNIPLLANGKPALVHRNKMTFSSQPTAEQFEIVSGVVSSLQENPHS